MKKYYDFASVPTEIDSMTRSDVDPEFKYARAHRLNVAKEPAPNARQAHDHDLLKRRILRIQPVLKRPPFRCRLIVSNLDLSDIQTAPPIE